MSDPNPSRWSSIRDSCAAMRELLIVVAMLSLLFAQTFVRSILERAGVRSVAGVEFDATTLAESESQLAAAQAQVDELRNQLALTQQQFNQVATTTGNTRNPEFTKVSEMLLHSQRQLEATEGSIGRSRMSQMRLSRQVADAESVELPTSSSTSDVIPATSQRKLVSPSELFNR